MIHDRGITEGASTEPPPAPVGHAEALQFLLDRKDFERASSFRYSAETLKLDRMRRLLEQLGDPQQRIPIVHVAGTKGKGSTAAMIAATLTAARLRTGLFTSPHLMRIEERFRVDGTPCAPAELVRLVERLRPIVDAMQNRDDTDSASWRPTYFEMTTALAILHFERAGVDAAVLEVGLGGRLDSTNVCTPKACVITNISFDHTKQLGNSLTQIAREKAGIIKQGIPVISGVASEPARDVIRQIADEHDAPLYELDRDFAFTYRSADLARGSARPAEVTVQACGSRWSPPPVRTPLQMLGSHQAANAAVAVATVWVLRQQGWRIPSESITGGLASAAAVARVELVCREPVVIVDSAHNVASIEALCETVGQIVHKRPKRLILGVTRDKDVPGMLRAVMDRFDELILTRYVSNPRAMPVEDLANLARKAASGAANPPAIQIADHPSQAWEMATDETLQAPAAIVITGSFFLAAELRDVAIRADRRGSL